MRHSEYREWAEVALGDSRQVYARKADARPNDPLVFMPDGAALRFREAAKSGALICPVPNCSSPKLTTRGSDDRRDHFVHVRLPENDEDHHQRWATAATHRLLYDWMAGQKHVNGIAEAEMKGVAVALVARLDDAAESKVALCYVDTRMGADGWEKRNAEIRSQGLAVAWIFALREQYFSPPDPADPLDRDRTDLIVDRAIYRRMRGRGSWPLLLNLEQQKLANVIKPDGGPAKQLGLPLPQSEPVQHFVANDLAVCRLCPYGIATPVVGEYFLEKSRNSWLRGSGGH